MPSKMLLRVIIFAATALFLIPSSFFRRLPKLPTGPRAFAKNTTANRATTRAPRLLQ